MPVDAIGSLVFLGLAAERCCRVSARMVIQPLVADAGKHKDHRIAVNGWLRAGFRRCPHEAVLYSNDVCHARLQKLVETDERGTDFTLPACGLARFLPFGWNICALLSAPFPRKSGRHAMSAIYHRPAANHPPVPELSHRIVNSSLIVKTPILAMEILYAS
jgi:hypothetical protein